VTGARSAELDASCMRRALDLAERAAGLTSPNPMVGAVVVRDGIVVGEGFHRAAGQPHAEVEALVQAGERARGATLYVTLEPCVHQGRTPPCVPAVITAGIRRVVIATGDPSSRVAGRGIEALRQAGLSAEVGLLGEEATALNRVFFTYVRRGRPHVILKAGMTLDGKIADVHGISRWITGEGARAEAHRLRSGSDAIVVGIGTALRDDPALTVRLKEPWPREPYRVVIDSDARLPISARLIHAATPARAIVAVGLAEPTPRIRALEETGATVVRCPAPGGRVDVARLLAWLAEREVTAVLLEGGAEANAAFLDAELVDRVAIFIAPLVLGGRTAPTVVGGDGRPLKEGLRLRGVTMRRVGVDFLVEGDIER
jgi:diaminohydroxyphosphoribosylaminopyrimidine deaminase / 5-amino-6-(5-phosphoribosylamino)uracil reductase